MFYGKSEERIRRRRRAQYGKLSVAVFKPMIDNRYADDSVVSHNGTSIIAHPIKKAEEIFQRIDDSTEVVGIDEVQFFDEQIISITVELANRGIRVIVAGLDTDFRGVHFGPITKLIALSEVVMKLNAICAICGTPTSRTQR